MRNFNHVRPELRLKDNLRREFDKLGLFAHQADPLDGWPSNLQPVAQNPRALAALKSFFDAFDAWVSQDEGHWNPKRPSDDLKAKFNQLLAQRIVVSHSSGLTICDWLLEFDEHEPNDADFRTLLRMFRDWWQ